MQCYKVNMVQKHSLHAKTVILLVKHKGKKLTAWFMMQLKQWPAHSWQAKSMNGNKYARKWPRHLCVYLRWYGDELFEVDWRDLSELTNLQRSRKSQIQKQNVQHLTTMKVNDLYTDATHIQVSNENINRFICLEWLRQICVKKKWWKMSELVLSND